MHSDFAKAPGIHNCKMGVRLITIMILFVALLCEGKGEVEVEVPMEMKVALDPKGEILYLWGRISVQWDFWWSFLQWAWQGGKCFFARQRIIRLNTLSSWKAQMSHWTVFALQQPSREKIPREPSILTELLDLYLNVNMLSGPIPKELGAMSSLQGIHSHSNTV